MHKLERPEVPPCLDAYQRGPQDWRRIGSEDKREIWEWLDTMQAGRCAYCEDQLSSNPSRRHIEHFRKRSDFPRSTFQWENLFGSCKRSDRCGVFKDQTKHDPDDLIKPDVHDPDDYLRFLSDGRIVPRSGLPADPRLRAEETLRVFNLDHEHGALRWMRYKAVRGYLSTAHELAEWCALDEKLYTECLRDELEAISGQPFETAIRHLLTEV